MIGIKGNAAGALAAAFLIAVLSSTSTQGQTPTSCPACESPCVLDSLVSEPDGCPACVCPKTCENVTCPANQTCVLPEIVCVRAPCFPDPACVPKKVCPQIRCRSDCVLGKDSSGCSICVCPRTCKDIKCPCDEECTMVYWSCIPERSCPPPSPVCVPKTKGSCLGLPNRDICGATEERWFYNATARVCQPFKYGGCSPCSNTFRTDADCRRQCTRVPSCRDIRCLRNEVCELRNVTCKTEPCYPQPVCVPRCPTEPPCNIRCAYGLETDANGCQLCKCLPDPTTPAPCPLLTSCYIKCAYGQETDANGCPLCECRTTRGPPTRGPPTRGPPTRGPPTRAPCVLLRECLYIKCAYGQEVDENGCSLCRCRTSPATELTGAP